jgi:D-beta-D-heptose 7-phosphate kinase/D-beta-D-heptose 1-phosphate adenosyltransferase
MQTHLGIDELFGRFDTAAVVVLGDIMLDEYWWGSVERISPEAPVPVVAIERQESKLGGAANVARNILALGGTVATVGVIGADRSGETVGEQFDACGLDTAGLIADASRPTTVKTRIVAHNQQVVRADAESTQDVDPALTAQLITITCRALETAAGVVISDYGKGVITEALLDAVVEYARSRRKFVVVDPKDAHFSVYKRVTTLTPNHHEAGFMAGRKIRDLTSLQAAGFDLLTALEAESLLITRGEQGMALFEPSGQMTLIPTVAKQVYDVTGAGDTVIATVATSLAAGGSMLQSAYAANLAAGEVIKEIGTAFTSVAALRTTLAELPEPEIEIIARTA